MDIGEGFPNDEALLEFATSANVCCGEHAGNWELTLTTIAMCRSKGVRIGMHPGFPDRQSMGRRVPKHIPGNWLQSLTDQSLRFWEWYKPAYLKPHGAWYNILASLPDDAIDPQSNGDCARVLFELENRLKLPIMIMPMGGAFRAIQANGGRVICEGFADRGYGADGTLIPRMKPGAILEDSDAIQKQVLALTSKVDSICLHGDSSSCLEFAELVKRTLVDGGYEVGF